MKRPYLSQLDRMLYRNGTTTGDIVMLAFRIQQLKRAISRALPPFCAAFLSR